MSERWYAARTMGGMARVAQRELMRPYGDRDAFEVLLPTMNDGRLIFGPYIFILFDIDRDYWEPINSITGIHRLLPVGLPEPLPMPQDFMAELIVKLGRGDFDPKAAEELVYAFSKDEECRVTSGAWEGHTGKFMRRRKGFINLELVLFNRTFELPIPAHQVRPALPKAA